MIPELAKRTRAPDSPMVGGDELLRRTLLQPIGGVLLRRANAAATPAVVTKAFRGREESAVLFYERCMVCLLPCLICVVARLRGRGAVVGCSEQSTYVYLVRRPERLVCGPLCYLASVGTMRRRTCRYHHLQARTFSMGVPLAAGNNNVSFRVVPRASGEKVDHFEMVYFLTAFMVGVFSACCTIHMLLLCCCCLHIINHPGLSIQYLLLSQSLRTNPTLDSANFRGHRLTYATYRATRSASSRLLLFAVSFRPPPSPLIGAESKLCSDPLSPLLA